MREITEKKYGLIFSQLYPYFKRNSVKISGDDGKRKLLQSPNSKSLYKKFNYHATHIEGFKRAMILSIDNSSGTWFLNVSKTFTEEDFLIGIEEYKNYLIEKREAKRKDRQSYIKLPIEEKKQEIEKTEITNKLSNIEKSVIEKYAPHLSGDIEYTLDHQYAISEMLFPKSIRKLLSEMNLHVVRISNSADWSGVLMNIQDRQITMEGELATIKNMITEMYNQLK